VLTGNTPSSDASAAKVLSYFQTHKHKTMAGAYLIALSLFFGLFFFGALRGFLRRDPRTERLAAISYGGAILFAVSGGLAAGSYAALADVPHRLGPQAAQALNVLNNDLAWFALLAGLGTLLVATGLAIVRSRLLPRWLGWLSIVAGIVALTPIGWIALFALAVIVLILAGFVCVRDTAPVDDTATPA
jgi:hypothetical protein